MTNWWTPVSSGLRSQASPATIFVFKLRADPAQEIEMENEERENRQAALNEAARHRLADEKADDVVANAEKYFKFLQGKDDT